MYRFTAHTFKHENKVGLPVSLEVTSPIKDGLLPVRIARMYTQSIPTHAVLLQLHQGNGLSQQSPLVCAFLCVSYLWSEGPKTRHVVEAQN